MEKEIDKIAYDLYTIYKENSGACVTLSFFSFLIENQTYHSYSEYYDEAKLILRRNKINKICSKKEI